MNKEVQHCVVPPYLSIVITFSFCNIIVSPNDILFILCNRKMSGSWWYLLLLVIGYTIIYIYQSINVARYLQVYIGTLDRYHSSLFHCR